MSSEKINVEEKDSIERVFNFLLKKYSKGESFFKKELEDAAQDPNFITYFSKKYKHMLDNDPNNINKYFVSTVFKKYNRIDKFRKQVSQSSRTRGEYYEEKYRKILIFEFYMPLNNEGALRSALDDLFYIDPIKRLIARVRREDLYNAFPKKENESDESYVRRLLKWISERFGGYSIGTVVGRYKNEQIKSFAEVCELAIRGQNYLIDESTAIVRFIFHIGKPIKKENVDYTYSQFISEQSIIDESYLKEEVNQIKFFFKILFVKTILTLVEGEDEIWMIERGIGKPRLYKWKSKVE